MVPAQIIQRVFFIRCGTQSGTAFTIDEGGREYLVTAKHVLSEFSNDVNVDVYSNGSWISLQAKLVGHANDGIDVSVLSTQRAMTPPNLHVINSQSGLTYGGDAYFLGFPFGMVGPLAVGHDRFPLPFVKKAIISQFWKEILYLDGYNNPGFSGGPVCFKRPSSSEWCIAAVVSGYRNDLTSGNVVLNGLNTGLLAVQNSGIIISYDIAQAILVARSNPIGFPIDKSFSK